MSTWHIVLFGVSSFVNFWLFFAYNPCSGKMLLLFFCFLFIFSFFFLYIYWVFLFLFLSFTRGLYTVVFFVAVCLLRECLLFILLSGDVCLSVRVTLLCSASFCLCTLLLLFSMFVNSFFSNETSTSLFTYLIRLIWGETRTA